MDNFNQSNCWELPKCVSNRPPLPSPQQPKQNKLLLLGCTPFLCVKVGKDRGKGGRVCVCVCVCVCVWERGEREREMTDDQGALFFVGRKLKNEQVGMEWGNLDFSSYKILCCCTTGRRESNAHPFSGVRQGRCIQWVNFFKKQLCLFIVFPKGIASNGSVKNLCPLI